MPVLSSILERSGEGSRRGTSCRASRGGFKTRPYKSPGPPLKVLSGHSQTKQTFDRLIKEGFSKLETMKLIGFAVSSEISALMREGRVFDAAAYVKM